MLWAVNWLVSIPAILSPVLAHLDIVPLDTPFMWLYEADKQFSLSASQRRCFLKVLFQCEQGTVGIISLITAYINAVFSLIGFSGLNVF